MHLSKATTIVWLSAYLAIPSSSAIPTNWGDDPSSQGQGCSQSGISAQWRDTIVDNWLQLWAGDYSYLNRTVSPNISVYQDLFPAGNGAVPLIINNSTAMLGFVKQSRTYFSKYGFIDDMHFGEDNLIALRWTLNAVYMGGMSTATLAPNSSVAYNGTDIMTLDRCTGLIEEVKSSQDFIQYFHQLGVPLIKI